MGSQSDEVDSYLGVMLTFLFFFSIFVVIYYAETGFPWHSYITLTIGYFCSFGILLIIPIDIANAIVSRRTDLSVTSGDNEYDDCNSRFVDTYNTFFTVILIFGSVVLVFEEYYNTDGYYTVFSKIKNSFYRMSFDTVVPLVIGLIILGILISQKVLSDSTEALKLTVIIILNTVYELFLVLLLAYGLYEVPRGLWTNCAFNLDAYHDSIVQVASSDFKAISASQLEISLICADVLKTKEAIKSHNVELTSAINILASECPPEFQSSRVGHVAIDKKTNTVTIHSLAALRCKMNYNKHKYRMAQAKVERTKSKAYYLEDLIEAKQRFKDVGTKVIKWTEGGYESTEYDYNLHLFYYPLLSRLAAIICAGLSIMSFLGVACSIETVSNNSSPYFKAVHQSNATLGKIAIFVLLTLGYATYVTFWALFSMQLAGLMELVPFRTTPDALSFNVRMVARLAAPLGFFYLGWISENGMKTGHWTYNDYPVANQQIDMTSSFSQFYQLERIHGLVVFFGTACPVILFIFEFLFLTNAFNYILIYFGLANYQFGNEIVTDEQMREGKRQLARQKSRTVNKYRLGKYFSYDITSANYLFRLLGNALKNFLGHGYKHKDANGESDEDNDRGIFSSFFGIFGRSKESVNELSQNSNTPSRPAAPTIPGSIFGAVERKFVSKNALGFTSTTWKEMYVEVRTPGKLYFFKDRNEAAETRLKINYVPNDANSMIDLQFVINFSVNEATKAESSALTIDSEGNKIEIRFKTKHEAARWKEKLIQWKDYSIDYAQYIKTGAVLSNPVVNQPTIEDSTLGDSLLGGSNLKTEIIDTDDLTFMDSHVGISDKPKMLSGVLEIKKNSNSMFKGTAGEWDPVFCRIDEKSGQLLFFKDKDDRTPLLLYPGISLIEVVDINADDATTRRGDYSRFYINMGDTMLKFKVNSSAEGESWVRGLEDWRDYFLLNLSAV